MQVNLYNKTITNAKPFLKWVGGKRQLIPEIERILPSNIKKTKKISYYFEPFIGGGALFFHLSNTYNIEHTVISDVNKELILTYNVIKKDHETLIEYLKKLSEDYIPLCQEKRKEYFLNIRSQFNKDLENFNFKTFDNETIKRASYIIFMNKTCFNGLYRVNSKGEFNVPHGRYKNPLICDEENLKEVSKVLNNVDIRNASYLDSEELINENSLVYLDPPYRPISKTSSFTSYSSGDFNDEDQKELAQYYKRISDKGAYAILSNSDPHNVDENDNFFDDLYKDYTIERINANRSINSNADKRGPINELLIRNY